MFICHILLDKIRLCPSKSYMTVALAVFILGTDEQLLCWTAGEDKWSSVGRNDGQERGLPRDNGRYWCCTWLTARSCSPVLSLETKELYERDMNKWRKKKETWKLIISSDNSSWVWILKENHSGACVSNMSHHHHGGHHQCHPCCHCVCTASVLVLSRELYWNNFLITLSHLSSRLFTSILFVIYKILK